MIVKLRERRAAIKASIEALASETRDLTEDESTQFDAGLAEMRKIDERITELQAAEAREAISAATRVATGQVPAVEVKSEPNPVYRQDRDHETSFFRDLAAVQLNRSIGEVRPEDARARLTASQETRAGDMTTVAGAGGTFAPPLWKVEDFIALARAGRVTANLMQSEVLPSGISSINLPKVATGASSAVQALQNSVLSDTAMTTTSVSTGITTHGGKQIISMQLLEQSGIPFDRVILGDLARADAIQVDAQVLYGTNANNQVNGLVNVGALTAFTTASPAPASVTSANSLYYTVQKAAAAMQRAIFQVPNALVMSPERWAWILGAVDATARPFVIPDGSNFNPVGTAGQPVAQGLAGHFGAYPVYTDPNISLTANSATNQDEIYVLQTNDLWLYESAIQSESFTATYADNASVLFRLMGYMGFISNRHTGNVGVLRGTGLVAP